MDAVEVRALSCAQYEKVALHQTRRCLHTDLLTPQKNRVEGDATIPKATIEFHQSWAENHSSREDVS
jgi:hypothetical protein